MSVKCALHIILSMCFLYFIIDKLFLKMSSKNDIQNNKNSVRVY